ncbi:MAG: hypothetical protein RIR04_600, partial [Pseudomonadota bacterium]
SKASINLGAIHIASPGGERYIVHKSYSSKAEVSRRTSSASGFAPYLKGLR